MRKWNESYRLPHDTYPEFKKAQKLYNIWSKIQIPITEETELRIQTSLDGMLFTNNENTNFFNTGSFLIQI